MQLGRQEDLQHGPHNAADFASSDSFLISPICCLVVFPKGRNANSDPEIQIRRGMQWAISNAPAFAHLDELSSCSYEASCGLYFAIDVPYHCPEYVRSRPILQVSYQGIQLIPTW